MKVHHERFVLEASLNERLPSVNEHEMKLFKERWCDCPLRNLNTLNQVSLFQETFKTTAGDWSAKQLLNRADGAQEAHWSEIREVRHRPLQRPKNTQDLKTSQPVRASHNRVRTERRWNSFMFSCGSSGSRQIWGLISISSFLSQSQSLRCSFSHLSVRYAELLFPSCLD